MSSRMMVARSELTEEELETLRELGAYGVDEAAQAQSASASFAAGNKSRRRRSFTADAGDRRNSRGIWDDSTQGSLKLRNDAKKHVDASDTVDILGLSSRDFQSDKMGRYEVIVDKVKNRRPCYQMEDDGQFYLFFGDDNKWYVADLEDMEKGSGVGYVMCESQARTPQQIVGKWWVADDSMRQRQ